jgi:HSP20 family protein
MKSLIPWRGGSIWEPFEGFRQEMENAFQRFLPTSRGNGGTPQAWIPSVDVEETDKELLVKVDLPGVDPKNVEISVTDGALILKGEKKEEREDKKKNYHRVERFYGEFYREVPLPSGIDTEKISAQGSKGVVTVTIPKKPESQARKIQVKSQD